MRGILVRFICLLLIPMAAFAAKWTPYVGGALQYDIAFAHYNMKSLAKSGMLHDFGCWGSQYEVGLSSADFSVYGGYHFSTSPVYVREYGIFVRNGDLHQIQSLVEENAWKEKRVLLGFRWLMNGSGSFPVKPVVGFALSYGKSRLTWTETVREYPGKELVSREDVSRTSAYNIGEMIEFGMLIRTKSPLEITVLAQGHRFETNFGEAIPYAPSSRYVVLLPSVQIGLRYRIPVTVTL
jgi:hypothetical protein